MGEFTSLLLNISKEIEKGELETMKFCCRDYGIGAKRLEEIAGAHELFNELMKRELLGPENKEILVKLLEKADRIDLRNKVLNIQGSARVDSHSSVTDGPVANDILKDAHLNEIAEDLGSDWKQLGRKLDIPSSILGNIDEENRRVRAKAIEMMLRWKKRNGNDATGQSLADALIKIGRKDVAETLASTCQQDGINIDTSEGRRQGSSVRESSRAESGGLNSVQADLGPKLPMQESKRR